MISLHISGETADEFLHKARKTLEAFAKGLMPNFEVQLEEGEAMQAAAAKTTMETVASVDVKNDEWSDFPPSDDVNGESPVVETTAPVEKKRGRPAKKVEETKTETPKFTEKDIRDRVTEIIKNGKTRGNDDAANVAYVLKLFQQFGVKRVSELPPVTYADFMSASVPFVDGTAE